MDKRQFKRLVALSVIGAMPTIPTTAVMTSRAAAQLVLPSVQARGIIIQILGDGDSAKKALEMVREQLRETAAESTHTAEVIERVRGALETVGLYMGIREGIQQLKEFTAGAAEFGEKMQMASTRTGMTVETLSVLHYAADLSFIDRKLETGQAETFTRSGSKSHTHSGTKRRVH